MRTLWAASWRHLVRHPAQLALALVGLSLGVATIVAVDIATASSRRAFELSMDAVNGAATHQIIGGPQGIDEGLYVDLRTRGEVGEPRPALAPVVEGYVTIGDRTMQLVGLDPLASPELEVRAGREAVGVGAAGVPTASGVPANAAAGGSAGAGIGARDRVEALRRWLTEPGAVVMAAGTAKELGIATGQRFEIEVGGVRSPAVLIGQIQGNSAAYDALVLTDIAQAQEWLGRVGVLSRIDVEVPEGRAGEQVLAHLRERLPQGVQLHDARGRTRESLDMTGAFTTNLKAMSLLALLVSTLLIYGAISFAVVQRRRVIGILRALGATRAEVLTIVLTEAAALGVVGAALGLLLGLAIGRELITLVSRTINDLYFVVAVSEVTLPTTSIVKALLGGFGTALAAALLPALEVADSAPQLGLRRSVLESRAIHIARRLVVVSAVLAAAAGIIVLVSGRSLLAGFVALFMLLLSVAAITPAVLRGLARAAARLAGRASPIARLAFGDVAASLSRTGVAVAALGMAVAAMIGVSIMVESFRESLREWLGRTMRADIYVTAPGPGSDRPERRLEPGVIRALLATPGIDDHSESRQVIVESPSGPVPLTALQLTRVGYSALQMVSGEASRAWPEFERGAVLISEPLAWRLQLKAGDRLALSTASGVADFRIAAIYREYGNDRGNVLMSLAQYRRLWHDDDVTSLGIYLKSGAQPASVIAGLRTAAHGRQALLIRSNAALRAISMSIFERTFVITRVLYWLAAGVAAVGLISSLLAWELERSHELAIVRSIGLTPLGAAGLIEAQTGFMGLVALVAAIPAGLLTAIVLTDVINRRAFGWQIDLHLTVTQFTDALSLALVAALIAGLYPAWRTATAPIAGDIREE
ncbi:MAG TPA: FtsX-like permease family protein [Steroidobacteraceae bacterium]|nr:FtsX-like permease family protein [Steroidobacteraceae bacterium]